MTDEAQRFQTMLMRVDNTRPVSRGRSTGQAPLGLAARSCVALLMVRLIDPIQLPQESRPDQIRSNPLGDDLGLSLDAFQDRRRYSNKLAAARLSHQLNLARAFKVVHRQECFGGIAPDGQ